MENDFDVVTVEPFNEVYVRVLCEPSVAYELREYFTFAVPGAKFMPSYKAKVFDGKIRLYNTMTRLLYAGLVPYVEQFCSQRGYRAKVDIGRNEPTQHNTQQFLDSLKLSFQPRDYQLEAFTHGIQNNRALFLSPTASGKSFIIYLLMRYLNKKTLIIVPTTSLVHQMASDFESYGLTDADDYIHKVFSGQEKDRQANHHHHMAVYLQEPQVVLRRL